MIQSDGETVIADEARGDGGKPPQVRTDEAIKYLFTSEKQALIRLINSAWGRATTPTRPSS